jgi:hypothetical protein
MRKLQHDAFGETNLVALSLDDARPQDGKRPEADLTNISFEFTFHPRVKEGRIDGCSYGRDEGEVLRACLSFTGRPSSQRKAASATLAPRRDPRTTLPFRNSIHDTHRICLSALVLDCVFRDPEIPLLRIRLTSKPDGLPGR